MDRRDLPDDHPKGSLKNQWFFRHPSNFFVGIISKHPSSSGQIRDDPNMDLYWNSMRLLYINQVTEGLPKKITANMQGYFCLSNHLKFGSVLKANEKL